MQLNVNNNKRLNDENLKHVNYIINEIIRHPERCERLRYELRNLIESRNISISSIARLLNYMHNSKKRDYSFIFETIINHDLPIDIMVELMNSDSTDNSVKLKILINTLNFDKEFNVLINSIDTDTLAFIISRKFIDDEERDHVTYAVANNVTKNVITLTDNFVKYINAQLNDRNKTPNFEVWESYFLGLMDNKHITANTFSSFLKYFVYNDFRNLMLKKNRHLSNGKFIDHLFAVLVRDNRPSNLIDELIELKKIPCKKLIIKYCNRLSQYQITRLIEITSGVNNITYDDIIELIANSDIYIQYIIKYVNLQLTREENDSLMTLINLSDNQCFYNMDDSWPLPF